MIFNTQKSRALGLKPRVLSPQGQQARAVLRQSSSQSRADFEIFLELLRDDGGEEECRMGPEEDFEMSRGGTQSL